MTTEPVSLLNSFEFEKQSLPVAFVETAEVIEGVACDVYKFSGDDTRDLGIIRIDPGYNTPKQRILKGDKTVEGYVSGKGKLVIISADGIQTEYSVGHGEPAPFSLNVGASETMQWFADPDSDLITYEICYPPYEEGRFENL